MAKTRTSGSARSTAEAPAVPQTRRRGAFSHDFPCRDAALMSAVTPANVLLLASLRVQECREACDCSEFWMRGRAQKMGIRGARGCAASIRMTAPCRRGLEGAARDGPQRQENDQTPGCTALGSDA